VSVHQLAQEKMFLKDNREEKMEGKTERNLIQAFAGESQANRKYLAFAKQAEKEGYHQVAKLFRAVAEAETIHALSHLNVVGKVGTTAENLKAAIDGETFEFVEMYPPMIDLARREENKAALRSFTYANAVETVHATLYKEALEEMGNLDETDYHVCSVCGFTCGGEAPGQCPICGSGEKAFYKVG